MMDDITETQGLTLGRRIFIATVSLLLIALVVFALLVAASVRRGVEEIQLANIAQADDGLADSVDLYFAYVATATGMTAEHPGVLQSLASGDYHQMSALFQRLKQVSPFIQNVFLTDEAGVTVTAYMEDVVGRDVSDKHFWNALPRKGGPPVIEPYPSISPVNGHPIMVFAAPVVDEEFRGALIAGLDLMGLAEQYLTNKSYGEEGYPFIIDDRGIVLSHPVGATVLADLSSEPFFQQMKGDYLEGNDETVIRYVWEGRQKRLVYERLDAVPWFLAVSVWEDDLLALSVRMRNLVVLISAVAVAVISAEVVLLVRHYMIRRIRVFAVRIARASTGDLTVRAPVEYGDEITALSRRFNELMNNSSELVTGVIHGMDELSATGNALERRVEAAATSVTKINAQVSEAAGRISSQTAAVAKTAAVTDDVANAIHRLSQAIESQAASVTQSSSSVEQLIASIRSVTEVTDTAQEEVGSLAAVSDEGRKRLEEMTDVLGRITTSSDELRNANDVITDIAARTNLLAMNAAIEAAHAGEAGRGFAVVAAEIRSLAETAATESRRVNATIGQVATGIADVVERSASTSGAFGEIAMTIRRVQTVFTNIRTSLLEQSSGSRELLATLAAMQDRTDTVQQGSRSMTEANEQIRKVVEQLTEISHVVGQAIEEIGRGSGEIDAAARTIVDLSARNSKDSERVRRLAREFTVGE